MTQILLIVGVAAAAMFVAILLIEGMLRPSYNPTYHMGSALSLGERGWIQIVNFLQLGIGMFAFAVGVYQTLNSIVGALLVAIFGLGAIVVGVFRMDPMRGYPPGAPAGTPAKLTWHHKVHDLAGPVMFFAIFGACLALAGYLPAPWRLYTVLTAIAGLTLTSRLLSRGRKMPGTLDLYNVLSSSCTVVGLCCWASISHDIRLLWAVFTFGRLWTASGRSTHLHRAVSHLTGVAADALSGRG
jgi:hypothetical protein